VVVLKPEAVNLAYDNRFGRGTASGQASSCAVLASSTQSPSAKIGTQSGRKLWSPLPAGYSRSSGRDFGSALASAVSAMRRRAAGKRDVSQYQTEIPVPRVERIEFRIHVGQCRHCGGRVQGRHRRQTSDAISSAASQLGPRVVALATQLNKGFGPALRQDCGRAGGSVRAAGQSRWTLPGVGTGGPQGRTDLCGPGGTSPRQSQCDPR
jgi:hypothetical protein